MFARLQIAGRRADSATRLRQTQSGTWVIDRYLGKNPSLLPIRYPKNDRYRRQLLERINRDDSIEIHWPRQWEQSTVRRRFTAIYSDIRRQLITRSEHK